MVHNKSGGNCLLFNKACAVKSCKCQSFNCLCANVNTCISANIRHCTAGFLQILKASMYCIVSQVVFEHKILQFERLFKNQCDTIIYENTHSTK